MVVAVVVEVLVVGLEHAPVVRILVGLIAVLPEQNAILVLDEELPRGARLAAEIVQDGADLGVEIRQAVEESAKPPEIVGLPPHVREDELGLRVPREEAVSLGDQILERGKAGAIEIPAVGEQAPSRATARSGSRAAERTRPDRRCE